MTCKSTIVSFPKEHKQDKKKKELEEYNNLYFSCIKRDIYKSLSGDYFLSFASKDMMCNLQEPDTTIKMNYNDLFKCNSSFYKIIDIMIDINLSKPQKNWLPYIDFLEQIKTVLINYGIRSSFTRECITPLSLETEEVSIKGTLHYICKSSLSNKENLIYKSSLMFYAMIP